MKGHSAITDTAGRPFVTYNQITESAINDSSRDSVNE